MQHSIVSEIYNEYKSYGLSVIPIEWDVEKKEPVSHRLWSDTSNLSLQPKHNALMIKTDNDYACIDFDIKNTENKEVFNQWFTQVKFQREEILSKIFIEETRNKGYHVWIKYDKLNKKTSLAESEKGAEVIALYCKTPLVYTFPTPGYKEFLNSMNEVEMLTSDEFEYLISTSQAFNEYKPDYDPNKKAVSYPAGHEQFLLFFDTNITNQIFIDLLKDIGLTQLDNYQYNGKEKFIAFRRQGSTSDAISAKVYFKSKRVLIFSASLHNFPNWHNRFDYDNHWSLPASFLLFYKLGRDWNAVIDYAHSILESVGIDYKEPEKYNGAYPLDVFPASIKQSILDISFERSLAPQFVATSALWTVSSLAGTRYTSDFNGDARCILFCLMVAPVSVGKTPAYKVVCENTLKSHHEESDKIFERDLQLWNEEKAKALVDKKTFTKKRPVRFMPIAADGTTEGYIHTSMSQKNGIGIYQDEAETIFNAGSFKGTNDSISFFTQAFSGGRITQIRADDNKTRVVSNLNLNLLMGTQPKRLKNIFTEDRLSSGFASRFLMVESDYIELNVNADPFSEKKEMCIEWNNIISALYKLGYEFNYSDAPQIKVLMKDEAKSIYRDYYKKILIKANSRISDKYENYIIGTEAKMSAYLPRLIMILAILNNPISPEITEKTVHDGWLLYEYYSNETVRIIASLHEEIETGLPKDLELLYQSLPSEFTRKEAVEVCTRINLNERRFDVSMRRKDFKELFIKSSTGKYTKK